MDMTQWMPLLGVVLGASLSFGTAYWMDAARYNRDQTSYWRKERLAAFGDFVIATKSYMAVLFRMAAARGLDDQTELLTPPQAEPLLALAFQERDAAFERVRLVAGADVVRAARDWVRLVYAMRRALSEDSLDRRRWTASMEEANRARDEFHRLAREELRRGAIPK
ncbi:MAG: hypothetical protein WAQ75_11440 [Propionicimonas sp.]